MRICRINDKCNEHTIINFVDCNKLVSTQTSINKRLKNKEIFGVAGFINNITLYWTLESNEELKTRLEQTIYKPIIFD